MEAILSNDITVKTMCQILVILKVSFGYSEIQCEQIAAIIGFLTLNNHNMIIFDHFLSSLIVFYHFLSFLFIFHQIRCTFPKQAPQEDKFSSEKIRNLLKNGENWIRFHQSFPFLFVFPQYSWKLTFFLKAKESKPNQHMIFFSLEEKLNIKMKVPFFKELVNHKHIPVPGKLGI